MMDSPDSSRISIKQEEPEDHAHLDILQIVVCKEEIEQERSPSPSHIKEEQEESQPPHIKEEQEELLQTPQEPGGLLAVKSEHDHEDISSHFSEVEVELESDNDVTEDSDDWEETNGGVSSQSSQTRFFSCSDCPYAFKSRVFLYRHIKRTHSDLYCQMLRDGQITSALPSSATGQKPGGTDQPRSGSHQQQFAKTLTELGEVQTKKLLTFTGKKTHVCAFCSKSFTKADSLRRHYRVHTGEKPYQCNRCDMSFTQSNQLKTHIRSHTGEIPFQCKQCDKGFSALSHLKEHQRVHTGEKPFHCKYCNESFSWSATLKRHQQYVHAGDNPFQCKQCNKNFTTASSLKRHLPIHTKEKPLTT